MSELVFRTWLLAFLFLAAVGPLFIWKSRRLMEKVAATNPDWASAFPGRRMKSWLRIMTGEYAGLDQNLQRSCRALRTWCIVYLICLFTALAGAIFFIFFEG